METYKISNLLKTEGKEKLFDTQLILVISMKAYLQLQRTNIKEIK